MTPRQIPADFYLLKTKVLPTHLDLALGNLYQLGILTVGERNVQGNQIELTAQIKDHVRSKKTLEVIRQFKDASANQKIFISPKIKTVKRGAWTKKYQKYLKPFVLSKEGKEKIWIDPRGKLPQHLQANTLYITASLAFGTGTHPTTQLAARFLSQAIQKKSIDSLLDLGCGTGILAMLAKRLGVKEVHAVDIDPQALEMTRTNLKNNRMDGVKVRQSIGKTGKKFDLIIANIELIPLQKLYSTITSHLKKSGTLIVSGLLYRDCEELLQTYRKMRLMERLNLKGWSALLLDK